MSKQEQPCRSNARECREMAGLMDTAFFKALCDRNRIAILARLSRCDGPCNVSQLTECCPFDISLSVVSRHLAILRDAGIVCAGKRGKEVFYTVRHSEISSTLRKMADAIDACCPPPAPRARRKGKR